MTRSLCFMVLLLLAPGLSWFDAKAACEQRGGYQEDGAQEPDGGWRWVTDEPWSFTNWEYGQPDKAGGLIGSKRDDAERYNPTEHRLGYICEYEPRGRRPNVNSKE